MKNDISLQMANYLISLFLQESFLLNWNLLQLYQFIKKRSKLKCSNYRPTSLPSTLNKILEKMIYNRIYDFLEKYKLIYALQFGVRQDYSTSYALLNLTKTIMKALDEGNFAQGIFFWPSKGLWYYLSQYIKETRSLWNNRNIK